MRTLKLLNRFVDGRCENLCYVNASLNLLNSCKDFSYFIQQKIYLEPNNLLQNFPVSEELSKIFTGAVSSAIILRTLVATKSNKPPLHSWDQQDITEFHRTLLDVLTEEFRRNDCEKGKSLISKFSGSEILSFEFAQECQVCQYKPDDKCEKFNILSLDITSRATSSKLSEIIRDHYVRPDQRQMKCNCPLSDKKQVSVTSSIIQSPDYLFIELRRYRIVAGNQTKSKQIVKLDDILTIPSGENYVLTAVANHSGETIQSGHYVALVKSEGEWCIINDNREYPSTRELVTGPENVLLVYSKIEDDQLRDTNSEEIDTLSRNLENVTLTSKTSEPPTGEKVPCLGCGKLYKHIFLHIKGTSCQEWYDIESERRKYNLYNAKKVRENRTKSKEKDPESLAQEERDRQSRSRSSRKKTDPEGLAQKERERQSRSKSNRKGKDPEDFAQKVRNHQSRSRSNIKEKDPEGFAQKVRDHQSRSRSNRKEKDPEGFSQKVRDHQSKSREEKLKTAEGRIAAFHESVMYGAIFPCVCCHRVMFKRQVIAYEGKVKDIIEGHDGLFSYAIGELERVPEIFDKYYLCKSPCWKHLKKGKRPGISHLNNLELPYPGQKIDIRDDDGNKIDEYTLTKEDIENLDLTDLEQSLIARSLIFLKIHKLPKSRMSSMKSQMVYVPINEDDTLNTIDTLIRTPSEAGILPVKVKRKMEYKHSYQEEFVSIPKIIATLKILTKVRHPEYRFLTEEMIADYEKRCHAELESDSEN